MHLFSFDRKDEENFFKKSIEDNCLDLDKLTKCMINGLNYHGININDIKYRDVRYKITKILLALEKNINDIYDINGCIDYLIWTDYLKDKKYKSVELDNHRSYYSRDWYLICLRILKHCGIVDKKFINEFKFSFKYILCSNRLSPFSSLPESFIYRYMCRCTTNVFKKIKFLQLNNSFENIL